VNLEAVLQRVPNENFIFDMWMAEFVSRNSTSSRGCGLEREFLAVYPPYQKPNGTRTMLGDLVGKLLISVSQKALQLPHVGGGFCPSKIHRVPWNDLERELFAVYPPNQKRKFFADKFGGLAGKQSTTVSKKAVETDRC
jgi:hypothetical protein